MVSYSKISLTKRELQVLRLIAEGLTDEQIASTLFFSIHNANAYRKKLLEKFQANNAALLVATAFRRNFIR